MISDTFLDCTITLSVSEKVLRVAMKKAVEAGLISKAADSETYLKNWEAMKQTVEAALAQAVNEAQWRRAK